MECNSIMKKKNSQRHEYLVCSNNNCLNKSIRYDMLEGIMLKEVNTLVSKYYDSELLKKYSLDKKIVINKISALIRQQSELRNRVSKTDNYLKFLYEDKVDGIVTDEYFIKLSNDYKNDKKIIEDNIKSIDNKINYYKNYFNDDITDKYKCFNKLNKVIVDEFVDKIYVGKIINNKRMIKIRWDF
jgi:site-specific DNA recombinase